MLSDEIGSEEWNVLLTETWTRSELTFTNFSFAQYGQYTCQCENYQYTVEEIRHVLGGVQEHFKRSCSELQNITIGANGKRKY